jgi:hypothetical protein
MKKLLLALIGAIAALALLAGLATVFPFAAIFVRIAMESLRPQVIGWDAKNAWAKCDGAIDGRSIGRRSPPRPVPPCICAPTKPP